MVAVSHSFGSSTAFVLDDEPQVGALICKMLRSLGITGRQFVGASEFLAELGQAHPDIIILDLALGQTDAVEVIRQLEMLKFAGRVLLMSGRDQGTLKEISRIGQAHGLCMLPTLRKPFRSAELKGRLLATPEAGNFAAARSVGAPAPQAPQVKADLSEALEKNWLEVWYQPKIALGSLEVCGAEALIRARHPEHGLISPAQFLPVAGDPLYGELSLFVVRQTMAHWGQMADSGLPLKLAVNIPASILSAPGFVNLTRQALPADARFPGMIIEITEDELIGDPERIYEIATQLRLYDIWISIDDFGTGNASLSRLKDLPFVELKLDRSFVSNCAADPLKRTLCRSVVDLAHRFHASVCAEGVETDEELACLTRMGFDIAQGYLFAKPMPLQEFIGFIRAKGVIAPIAKPILSSAPQQRWLA